MIDPEPERKLESHEIRDLAVRGVATLGIRTLIIRLMGLAANLVLARLLTPHEFGVAAFGLTIVGLGAFITDGGLGGALLRQPEIRRRQLEAIFGAQLVLAGASAVLIAAIAAPLGTAGQVAAIMAISLPLDACKVPGSLTCERRLRYLPIVRAEIAEMLVYNVVAITAVALGAGVWGLAVAAPCRALVGAIVLSHQAGVLVRPRLLWSEVRPLYGFGLKLQGIGFVSLLRDQVLNFATAAIAGFAALGTLSLVHRLMLPIWLVFEGSWRVSFPTMSRLRETDRDVPAIAVRTLAIAATTTGLAVVAVGSATPALVPSLFGDSWDAAIPIVPVMLVALLIGGPMLACATGYLAAVNEPGAVLRAEIIGTVAAFLTALPLLVLYGVIGLATGSLIATLASDASLMRDLRRHGIHAGPVLLRSTASGLAAGALGWAIADALPPTLWAAAAGAIAGCAVYALLVWTFQRAAVRDTVALARRLFPSRPAPAGA